MYVMHHYRHDADDVTSVVYCTYLSVGGSSLITSHTGQSEFLEDLKIATPSVFRATEMLSGLIKKGCRLYSSPQYTSKISSDD